MKQSHTLVKGWKIQLRKNNLLFPQVSNILVSIPRPRGILLEREKKFTLEELKQYDGKDGRPAYIAYKGKVYDVTDDYLWTEGDHQGEHAAGRDLTEERLQPRTWSL